MIDGIIQSWSFPTKFMKLAKGLFHKFHMKPANVPVYALPKQSGYVVN